MVLLTQTQRCGNIWANPICLQQGCFTEEAAAALQGLCGKWIFFFISVQRGFPPCLGLKGTAATRFINDSSDHS